MSNVSLMKCLLSQILENITELLPVTRVKSGFYHHSNFVYRHFWPSPWSDGERTQSPYTDVVHLPGLGALPFVPASSFKTAP